MDVSYALLVEDHQRKNPMQDLGALRALLLPAGEEEKIPTMSDVESQNNDSLAQLQMMMKGVR